jgi:hypothetical protein
MVNDLLVSISKEAIGVDCQILEFTARDQKVRGNVGHVSGNQTEFKTLPLK